MLRNTKFDLHGIAGMVAAAIVLAPIVRDYLGIGIYIYPVLFTLFLILLMLDQRVMDLHLFQKIFIFLILSFLFFLGTYPLLAGFNREAYLSSAVSIGFSSSIAVLSCLSWNRKFYSCFIYTIVVVSLAVSLVVFYGFLVGSSDFRKVIEVGYLISGRIISLGCCCLAVYYLFCNKNYVQYLLFIVASLGVASCQSRAALLFVGTVLLFLVFFIGQKRTTEKQLFL